MKRVRVRLPKRAVRRVRRSGLDDLDKRAIYGAMRIGAAALARIKRRDDNLLWAVASIGVRFFWGDPVICGWVEDFLAENVEDASDELPANVEGYAIGCRA